jgi:hypothetical protein
VNMFAGFFGKRVTIRGLWPAKPLTRGNVLWLLFVGYAKG